MFTLPASLMLDRYKRTVFTNNLSPDQLQAKQPQVFSDHSQVPSVQGASPYVSDKNIHRPVAPGLTGGSVKNPPCTALP